MSENEKELAEQVRAGDAGAFEALITPYRKPLLNLALRMTRDMEDAKEASQETLFRAFRYFSNFDSDRSFRSWLFGILVNEARNARKKRAAARLSLDHVTAAADMNRFASPDPPPDSLHAKKELRTQIMECLEILSPRERETFLLRDIEGLSIKESAKALRCSTLSIRVHLSRARGKMKKTILYRFPHLAKEER